MKVNSNGEIIFKITEKLLPGFSSNVQEKLFVSIIGFTKDNKIAFVKLNEKKRSWELPGGAVLENEPIINAAKREFFEETGMQLIYPVKTLTIKNMYENVNKIHSSVFVVVGLIDENSIPSTVTDSEIEKCSLLSYVPNTCTFGKAYIKDLIQTALSKFNSEKNREMWNKAAQNYDEQTFISEIDVHYGPLLPGESKLKLLPDLREKQVLDLGCGTGNNLIALKNNGAKSGLGIDFCEEQIQRAKEKLSSPFELMVGDITNLDFIRNEKFDVVISVFAISFIKDIDKFFYIINQNLKPGGCVIVSTDHPNRKLSGSLISKNNNSRLRYWNISNQISIPYFHFLHSNIELSNAIKQAGLVLDQIIEPKILPLEKIKDAPYRSQYYIDRYKELSQEPYTIIFKAHKPLV